MDRRLVVPAAFLAFLKEHTAVVALLFLGLALRAERDHVAVDAHVDVVLAHTGNVGLHHMVFVLFRQVHAHAGCTVCGTQPPGAHQGAQRVIERVS